MTKVVSISVIVPTYRPGTYIWKCLDSLCAQTLSAKEFEIIIVINGCNEPYVSQIAQYAALHPNHQLVIRQTDEAGVSRARNLGLEACHGLYVTMIDDDDWVSPEYLQAMMQKAEEDHIVVADLRLIEETTGREKDYYIHIAYQQLVHKKATWMNTRSFFSSACGKLIPTKLIAHHRFNPSFRLGEDALFMFNIAYHVKTVTAAPPTAIYYVRERSDSASRSPLPFSHRVCILLRLTYAYIATWLKHPLRYHFGFFLSRIAATLRKLFLVHYQ